MNGLYELLCITTLFPLVLQLGASGKVEGSARKICTFTGNLSYPLYIIHYPLMYIFYRHVWNNSLTFGEVWPIAIVVVGASVALAWIAYRFYDLPLRRWLTEKWLTQSGTKEK